MSIREDVEKALDGLRQGFQADGADLTVENATPDQVTLRLVGGEETCWECIVPPQQLRDVVGSVLRDSIAAQPAVEVIDPRSE
ncbi:NifU family protein [Amycolatopsis sp. NPDC005232]|uniref:NifU family protein n=1 Tax=unclassified Amycolatopsis TaxID=2618356 RepID=UPI001C6A2767|nr:NifU family protein [Amycolatopsis sp. DSM 110486]QYN21161.1 NifU family protein [Amycolatopsis sp. DSM 110486]